MNSVSTLCRSNIGIDDEEFSPMPVPFPEMPFSRFRLANGLTLIVHEDRRAPLIATELRYNVGSKDEPLGRFGFAHLFEHLMFKQTANRRGNWHAAIAALGGSNVNATTTHDRTTYFQTVPTGAIDTVLWMEADRMVHLLEGLTAEGLKAEIEVIKNEKRQSEGAPLGGLAETVASVLYPSGHPYGHAVIGTFEDLDKANLDTARDWYRRWYGAANAILVLAGDISADEALAKVEHWFGDLPMGEPVRRATRWLPPRQGSQRLLVQDRVSNAGLMKVWIVPAYGDPDTVDLGLLASALTGSPGATLSRRLVEEEQLCTSVQATIERRYLCSEFCIYASYAPGADPKRVEDIINSELKKLITDGPDRKDIDQAIQTGRLHFLRAQDSLSNKAALLAASEMEFSTPDGYRIIDHICTSATPERIAAIGRYWLTQEALTIDVQPYVEVRARSSNANRICAPRPRPAIGPKFPHVERGVLSNGIQVKLARRPGAATVATVLLVEGGSGGDAAGNEGLSALTLGQVQNGTRNRDVHRFAALQADLNAKITAKAGLDTTSVRCNTLRDCYPHAVRLMADMALSPAFHEADFARARDVALANLDPARLTANAAADRATDLLMFGPEHMLARQPVGTSDSLQRFTRNDVVRRHGELFRSTAATLFVTGDLSLAEALAPLETAFGGWNSPGPASGLIEGPFAPQPGRYFVSHKGAAQSVIKAGIALPALGRHNTIGPALGVFSYIFGDAFGSRLNRNLREERGWTYGARSNFTRWRNLGSFNVNVSVQPDRTADALAEIEKELNDLSSKRPVTSDELDAAKTAVLLELPSYWTSEDAILAALVDSHCYGLPDNHYDRLGERMAAVGIVDMEAIVAHIGKPADMTFVVAGDPSNCEVSCLTDITGWARTA